MSHEDAGRDGSRGRDSVSADRACIRIRPLETADLDRVRSLWCELAVEGAVADSRYQPTGALAALFDDRLAGPYVERAPFVRTWIGATPFGEVVAFVHADPLPENAMLASAANLRIGALFVRPAHRGQGLGRALVAAVLEAAREAGLDRCEVTTLAGDQRAVRFWQQQQFRPLFVSLWNHGSP